MDIQPLLKEYKVLHPTEDFQISITQADINNSHPCDNDHCVISNVLTEYIHTHLSKGLTAYTSETISLYNNKVGFYHTKLANQLCDFEMDEALKDWLKNYDDRDTYQGMEYHKKTYPPYPINIHFDIKNKIATLKEHSQ